MNNYEGWAYSVVYLFRQLVHTQNGNDILEGLIVLEHLLHTTCRAVVELADNVRVEHLGRRVERVDGRVDTEFREGTGQHCRGIQVLEGCGRGCV